MDATNSKQCPICYTESNKLEQVCLNSHKLCEKCLFSLERRQCPFCKDKFRVVKKRENRYDVVFGEEDKQHQDMTSMKNVQREHQEILRIYQQSMAQHHHHTNHLQHIYHHQMEQQHHNHQHYHNHNSSHYHHSHSHHQMNPHQHRFQQIPFPQLSEQDYEQAFNTLLIPESSQISQSGIEIVHINQQNEEHQVNMRDPEYRETHDQVKRVLRRERDQEMYDHEVRARVNQGRYVENKQGTQQESFENQDQEKKQENEGGFLQKVGRFLIGIGQKLIRKQEPKDKNAESNKYKRQQECDRNSQRQQPSHFHPNMHQQHFPNHQNPHFTQFVQSHTSHAHQCRHLHCNHNQFAHQYQQDYHRNTNPYHLRPNHPQQYPNIHHQYHPQYQQHTLHNTRQNRRFPHPNHQQQHNHQG